ncbi:hypothetical protein [Pseudomonas sp. AK106]
MKLTGNPDPKGIELQPGVELWATQMSALVRSRMSGKITVLVDEYKHASRIYLAVDMAGTEDGDFSITFLTGQTATDYCFGDLETTCFDVVDMAHARLMIEQLLSVLEVSPDHSRSTSEQADR